MRSVILAFVLLGCVALAFGFENPFAHFKKLEGRTIHGKSLPASFLNTADHLSADPFAIAQKRDANISAPCLTALQAINANPICQVANGTQPDPSLLCEGACKQLWLAAHTQCTGPGQEGQIGAIFGIFHDLICLKDDNGNYCFPLFAELDKLGNDLTAQKLVILCSPCFYKLLNVIFSHPEFIGNASATDVKNVNAFFDLVCTRAEGKWCILTLQNDFCDANGNTDCLIQDLNVLCKDRCFKKILAKLWLFADPTSQDAQNLETMLRFACVENPTDNQYCLVEWSTSTANFNQNCPDATWNAQGCADTNCKAAATTVINTMGCCMQTYILFAENQGNATTQAGAAALEQRLVTAPCSFTLLPACPRQTGSDTTQKKFYIRMTWSWAAAHDATVRAAIIRDLAGFLGVPESDVVLVTFEKDDDSLSDDDAGVAVSFSSQGQDDTETANMSSEFDDASNSGTLTLPSTAAAYGSSGNTPIQAASTPTPSGKTSDASVISFMAVLSVVMVALTL